MFFLYSIRPRMRAPTLTARLTRLDTNEPAAPLPVPVVPPLLAFVPLIDLAKLTYASKLCAPVVGALIANTIP